MACVCEFTSRTVHSPNDNPPEPKLSHPLVWRDGDCTSRLSKQKVRPRLQGTTVMWRHDGRVWRQLTPEGCALMQRLARADRRRKLPVVQVLPDAALAREGDLCLVVEKHELLEFDRKSGKLVTVPETSHHYVDPLPRQRQRERLMEAQLQMLLQRPRHA
jgi:hypothetical protein